MIGSTRVPNRDRRHPQIAEGREPLLEQRTHRLVFLQVDTANPAASVVQIEIPRQLAVFGALLHRRWIGEMRLDVGTRTEQPLFLSAPQPDADRSIELQVQRLENACHLDHHSASRTVVGRARSGMP